RHASRLECRMVDGRLRVELLRINQLLDLTEVHDRKILGEDVVEAALRDAHVKRHLAAFEAIDRDARAALLALLAAAAGLALARADAASDAHPALAGAIIVTKIVELDSHCTRFRCVRAMDRPLGG